MMEDKIIREIISKLKSFKFVHSIILFGSKARGTEKEKSDIDICIIPKPDAEITLKERISLSNSIPENVDISFIDELPVYIRKRVFLEGRVMYTQDMYHLLTLSKINDLEYERHKRLTREYHEHVMENYLRELEEYFPEDEDEYLNNGLIKRACERAFQLASENLLDICNLVISEKGFGIPADSKDSIRKLAENRVIPDPLSTRLEGLIGFRNLLVHQYGRVDDSRAYYYLKEESKDFYEFIEIIDKFIELDTG